MAKKKKKGGLGGLYVMIALCVVCSALGIYGLMGKLETYQESDDSYAQLQQAALTVLPEGGAQPQQADSATAEPAGANGPLRTISPEELAAARANAAEDADGEDDIPEFDPNGTVDEVESTGPEEEEVVDEALIWMLKNQTEDELITDLPKAKETPAPESTPAPQDGEAAGAVVTEAPDGAAVTAVPADPTAGEAGQGGEAAVTEAPAGTVVTAAPAAPMAGENGQGGQAAGTAGTVGTEVPAGTAGTEVPAGTVVTEAPAGTAGTEVPAGTAATTAPAAPTAGEAGQGGEPADVAVPAGTAATEAPTGTVGTAVPAAPAAGEPNQDEDPAVTAAPADPAQAEPAITPEPTATPEPTPEPTPTIPPYIPSSGISMERAVTVSSARYAVNFDYLTLINDEVVGWIYQEGTPINYPVVRGDDNEYYLTHLFNRTYNKSGSVFMDAGNSAAFIDSATYLYGHHSKGGGMFATLSNYLEPEYYEAHPQFLLVTPFADYQVDVFAGMATFVEDEESWRPKTLETEQDMQAFLDLILSQSFIQAPEDRLPLWGDRLLVLVTCTNIHSNQRYVIYGRMRPIVYENSEESVVATKVQMDEKPTGNGYVTIDGVGTFMNYAQNDPIWERMMYESSGAQKRRRFGDGGCSPTAVATAIANLCPVEELPRLIGYANTQMGYTFCECSVNRYYCDHTHAQYQLRTGEEFLRYMPLAVANFATGNNIWEIKSRGNGTGTNMRYLEKICALYGIRVTVIEDAEELFRRMEEEKTDGIRRMAISCAVGGSPFTRSGHFVVICALDDEYAYFLDPLRRDNYADYDRRGYAEVLQPGVCRIARENIANCNLIPVYLLEKVQ